MDEVDTEKSKTENNKSVESPVPTKGKNENIQMNQMLTVRLKRISRSWM